MRVLFVEPFYGGSHRLFADRFAALSSHAVDLLTLPSSFWKWRMRGAHLSLAEKIRARAEGVECLLTTDMVSLAELVAVVPEISRCPRAVYFHENQLSYPVPKGEAPDVHFGFTNISTALAADLLVFNSGFHREEFTGGVKTFLKAMPDHRPRGMEELLHPRGSVVYPGVDCEELVGLRPEVSGTRPLTILWNHRWEFDKQPEVFFGALGRLAGEGLDFRVHVLGENFQVRPKPFLEARELLGEKLVTFGYLEERADYVRVLWGSDVVVSTAVQEFYGIAVMEAAYCGCRPLLPRRLVYPELYGEEFLYGGEDELEEKLRGFIERGTSPEKWEDAARADIGEKHDVRRSVARLDSLLTEISSRRRP
jgi:glycosyltransferase involved in cell wall biosynthesis